MSHLDLSQLNPYQSTTITRETGRLNLKYLLTPSALTKIICLVCEKILILGLMNDQFLFLSTQICDFISIIYIEAEAEEISDSVEYFLCMAVIAFMGTSLLIALHVTELNHVFRAPWTIIEITFSAVAIIFFFLISAWLIAAKQGSSLFGEWV